MKKALSFLAAALMSVSCTGTAVFVGKPGSADIKPYLYYYFGDEGAYRVSEGQFTEIMENKNLNEVVSREGLVPFNPSPSARSADKEIEKRLVNIGANVTERKVGQL